MKTIVIILLCTITFTKGQNILPFASQNNTIELSVSNSAAVDAGNVIVEVQNAPQWLTFANHKTEISNLKSGEVSTARFTFSVEKNAPVNQQTKLQFLISSPTGERWTKEIAIQVSPPEKFELYQNYPNPFNPSTTISYQLPTASAVSLKVFDIVGREVAILFEGMKEAGFHEEKFQAKSFASGMYIYQVAFKNEKGTTEFFRKKMLMVK